MGPHPSKMGVLIRRGNWTQRSTQGEHHGYLQTKEGGLGQILPSQPSEGTNPAATLIWDSEPPGLGEDAFLLCKPLSLRTAAPSEIVPHAILRTH